MELVGQPDRVLRVDVLRPVDARLGIPLLVLSLLVQGKEPGMPLVVLPREARVASAGDFPRVRRRHVRVLVPRGHELRALCPVACAWAVVSPATVDWPSTTTRSPSARKRSVVTDVCFSLILASSAAISCLPR